MDALVNAVSELFAAVLGRLGHVGRARGRANIRQDLDLLGQLRESPEFGSASPASRFLANHITAEVARYSGVVPRQKKPWGSIWLALFMGIPLAYLAFSLNEDGFDWFSLLPAIGAFVLFLAAIQLFTGDKEPESEGDEEAAVSSSADTHDGEA
jgi:hypothetical protein